MNVNLRQCTGIKLAFPSAHTFPICLLPPSLISGISSYPKWLTAIINFRMQVGEILALLGSDRDLLISRAPEN